MSRLRARGRLRPALLSGLVFPGVGQLVNGHLWRALAFGGGSLLLLTVFIRQLWGEVLIRMPQDPEALLDPTLPFRLATEIQQADSSVARITFALAALWLASIVDAWFAKDAFPATSRAPRGE